MRLIKRIVQTFSVLLISSNLFAQHEHAAPRKPADKKQHTTSEHENPASAFLMSEGAGTAVNPLSGAMSMSMHKAGKWNLMTHGYAFLNVIEQTGPRGDDEVFSSNHLMIMAERQPDSRSSLFLRAMFSFEPGTVDDGFYPLLFQTGETAEGRHIVDGQHPHDLFMELSAQYAVQINPEMLLHFYAGLRGDPALGPVAYPHRISAQELPQASLSHHLQDSTHIADNVLTAGLKYKLMRLEFSAFHGAEPDEERWDVDPGALDSWSTRFTYTPSDRWVGQVSTGRLKNPEELEPGNIHRTTASLTYDQPRPDGFMAYSFIWGWNHKFAEELDVYSYLFEGLLQFSRKNYITGRFEAVDKEELFANEPEIQEQLEKTAGQVFNIKALTIGYARDFDLFRSVQTGIGANVTFYAAPSALEPFYGEHPRSVLFYLRIRGGGHGQH